MLRAFSVRPIIFELLPPAPTFDFYCRYHCFLFFRRRLFEGAAVYLGLFSAACLSFYSAVSCGGGSNRLLGTFTRRPLWTFLLPTAWVFSLATCPMSILSTASPISLFPMGFTRDLSVTLFSRLHSRLDRFFFSWGRSRLFVIVFSRPVRPVSHRSSLTARPFSHGFARGLSVLFFHGFSESEPPPHRKSRLARANLPP